jgi:chromatin segregation and condensation protein Rec8/ScpA/Scc1 (kleisin family)
VTLERLAAIVGKALARAELPPEPELYPRPRISVRQKMDEIALLLRLGGRLSFERVVSTCRSRDEIVVVFFAVLELTKAELLVPVQPEPFGAIVLMPGARDGQAPDSRHDGAPLESQLAGVEDAARIGHSLDLAQQVHA